MTAQTVVQVTLWNSPYLGNFMASQLRLAERVRAEFGLSTHLVLADGAQGQPWLADLDAAGLTWSILPHGRTAVRAALGDVVRDHPTALIHTHFTGADVEAAAVAEAAGVPCVWHMHTGFLGYPLRQRLKDVVKIRLIARRRVARVIAVAPWLAALAQRRGVPGNRIVVVPNAIVLERFATPPDRSAARARLGIADDAQVALAFAWWPDVKGADVFVDAMRELAARRVDVVGLVVGEDALRAFLDTAVPDRPAWLASCGFIDDPAWLYAAADVFVSASRHEGQPYSVGEAMACGRPVVLSSIDGTAAYEAAPGASTFASEDALALAQRLGEVLGLPVAARAELGAANRAWMAQNMGIDAWCTSVCAVYADVLRTPSAEPMRDVRSQRDELRDADLADDHERDDVDDRPGDRAEGHLP